MRKSIGAAAMVVALSAAPALAQDTRAELARDLGGAMAHQAIIAYMCQDYLGGPFLYRTAKTDSVETLVHLGVDRNEAVLSAHDMEEQMRTLGEDGRQEIIRRFDTQGLAEVDRMGVCLDMYHEREDAVEVLKARLGLL